MMELGGFTVEGFQLGMQNMLPKVESTINDISAEVQKINTPTADIITKSASYQEVKSRMSVQMILWMIFERKSWQSAVTRLTIIR